MIKIVILFLIIISILIWTVFFTKLSSLNIIKKRNEEFEKIFYNIKLFDNFFNEYKGNFIYPYSKIFEKATKIWIDTGNSRSKSQDDNQYIINRMKSAINYSYVEIRYILNKYQSFFANITSLSPLIGLFGTVCGVIDTFHSIDMYGNNNITVIAPGIAEALITTAMSMIIAICSALMYGYFESKISDIEDKCFEFQNVVMEIYQNILYIELNGPNQSKNFDQNQQQTFNSKDTPPVQKVKVEKMNNDDDDSLDDDDI